MLDMARPENFPPPPPLPLLTMGIYTTRGLSYILGCAYFCTFSHSLFYITTNCFRTANDLSFFHATWSTFSVFFLAWMKMISIASLMTLPWSLVGCLTAVSPLSETKRLLNIMVTELQKAILSNTICLYFKCACGKYSSSGVCCLLYLCPTGLVWWAYFSHPSSVVACKIWFTAVHIYHRTLRYRRRVIKQCRAPYNNLGNHMLLPGW